MKRKFLSLIFALCLVFAGIFAFSSCGDDTSTGSQNPPSAPKGEKEHAEGLTYTLSDDGTYYIVSGVRWVTDEDIVIPNLYNGLPVKEIVQDNYSNIKVQIPPLGALIYVFSTPITTSNLKSITIPDSVTKIGDCAFSGCTSLTSVNIPDGVTEIGEEAFARCEALTSINIPQSVTKIGDYAFYYCKSLTSVNIPDGVTEIGEGAFASCEDLTSINIPQSVTKIGDYAFYYCKSLTSVNIPDGVTEIGEGAFASCEALTSINIPQSVTKIGENVFYKCKNLKFNVYNNAKYLGNATNPYLILVKATDASIISCEIHEDTKFIHSRAFSELQSTGTANGSTLISFLPSCKNLISIKIPKNIIFIGEYAFSRCSGLTNIFVEDGNTVYHSVDNCIIQTETKTLIAGCKNSIIPTDGSVTSIDNYTFSYCSELTNITIQNNITLIGDYVFENCSGLTEITIPDSVTSIGEGAFSGCEGLTSITIPDSVTEIGNYAFEDCTSLTSIEIPDSVTEISNSAFMDCRSLTSITIPDSVTSIGHYAFKKCTSLTSIIIPDSVTSIGAYAFYICRRLTSIEIPDSVTSIGNSAFEDCTSLQYNIHDNAKYLGNDSNPYVVLIGVADTSITSCEIHQDTKVIAGSAFRNCSSLTSVYITDIAKWCEISFYDNYSNPLYYAKNLYLNGELVTDLVIPDGVTEISNYAFYRCTSLTSIEIPDSVTSIGDYAFKGCTSLTSVTIGNGVTSIGGLAFYNCTSLTSITFESTMEQWEAITKGFGWNYNTGNSTIHCTDGDITI